MSNNGSNVPSELDQKQAEECYKYGLFAQCAYADSIEEAHKELAKNPTLPDSFQTLPDQLLREGRLKLLHYSSPLENVVKTDTEVLLAKLKHPDGGDELVMAFRGTEIDRKKGFFRSTVSDALTDLKFSQRPVTDIRGLKDRTDLEKCQVHEGFLTSFNDVIKGTTETRSMLDVINKDLFKEGEEKPVRVVCCGHSLGGALCTLAAFWCKATHEAFLGIDVLCYAFASPRVGDADFANKFNELLGNSFCYRFSHNKDIVPALPPAGNFMGTTW